MKAVLPSAITELRALIARPDGRIKHLYEVAEKALAELDRDYQLKPPPPEPPPYWSGRKSA